MFYVLYCRNRFSEVVGPLIVDAQYKLVARVQKNGGPSPPQPHFKIQNNNQPITAKDFVQLQIRIQIDKAKLPPLPPGARLDPMGHNTYSRNITVLNSTCKFDKSVTS